MTGRVHLLILALHLAPLMESACPTDVLGCYPGYFRIGLNCTDENECNTTSDDFKDGHETPQICGKNAACINTEGSFYCQCALGFRSSSQRINFTADSPEKCIDINECLENNDTCGPNSKCHNALGSYYCTCNEGFVSSTGVERFIFGQGVTCKDRNECVDNITICGKHACLNKPGNYSCVCNPGFGLKSGKAQLTRNGESCEEITDQKATTDQTATTDSEDAQGAEDLCKINKFICGGNGTCHNATNSGHRCACHAGFTNYGDPQGRCTELDCDTFASENHLKMVIPGLQDAVALMKTRCLELSESNTAEQVDGEALLETLLSAIDRLLSRGPLNNNKEVSVLLYLVENALRMIGPLLKHPETRRFKTHTEVELLVQRNSSSPQGPLTLSSTHAQLDSHWETAAGDSSYPGFATVSLLSYKGLETSTNHSFSGLKAQEGHSFQINSKVVTATISNKNTTFLKEPVTFTFSHLKESDEGNYTCVYWDAELGEGSWSDRGCFLVQSNATHTVCSCFHLSSFAVLMALYEFKDTFQLQLITWVGLSLSLMCLFLCILTFSLIRSIQGTRNTIHLHLCLSLFIANLIFLVGISRTESQTGCAVVAGLLHFFFLAAFCWMCLEGVQLFRMVVLVFNTTFRPLYMMAGGYGVPAVIVAISASANAKGYGTERHCWLNLEDGFIWSFFGPVCIIIMVNVFFFLITVWKLAQKYSSLNPDLDKLRKIKAFTITAVAQLCVLGTMWIFGCFQFEESTLAMSYLFTILNSLQGVLVFLMHCLLSKQVREEYGKILDSVCALQKTKYSEFSSNQSSNSKSQTSKSTQNTGESQI